jgi:hypothetical protein
MPTKGQTPKGIQGLEAHDDEETQIIGDRVFLTQKGKHYRPASDPF